MKTKFQEASKKSDLLWWMGPALALTLLSVPSLAFAADTTPPSKPVVTDDGAYTTSSTQLHAVWSSSDPESGIAEYQYQIRQDSTHSFPKPRRYLA